MKLFCLLFLVSCSSFNPADPWAQFPIDPDHEKELAEYEDQDLRILLRDVNKRTTSRK